MNPEIPSAPIPPAKSRLRPVKISWLVLVIICATAGYFYTRPVTDNQQSNNTKAGKPEMMPVSVAVATSRTGDMPVYLNGLGTVTALKTVTVRSRVDGELLKVAFTEGQLVRQGDLLAEIDPRPFQVQLKQAEGQLLRDQALLKNAELDLERYRTLQEQDSIAGQQTATQSALVKQYQGTVEMDQAQVDNARLQLSYARITAPIGGRIGLRLVDQGNIVHAGDTNGLLVITLTEPISVVFSLPEDVVPAVMKRWHTQDHIVLDAYDRAGHIKLASGKILAIDNQIDTSTGTLKLKAQFENHDHSLFANQFVNVKMHLDTLHDTLLAPTAAIQRGANNSTFIYVVKDDGTVSVRQVKTGPVEAETIAITEGLAADEKLVVDGADKLRDGSKVNVVKLDNQSIKPPVMPDAKPAADYKKPAS